MGTQKRSSMSSEQVQPHLLCNEHHYADRASLEKPGCLHLVITKNGRAKRKRVPKRQSIGPCDIRTQPSSGTMDAGTGALLLRTWSVHPRLAHTNFLWRLWRELNKLMFNSARNSFNYQREAGTTPASGQVAPHSPYSL